MITLKYNIIIIIIAVTEICDLLRVLLIYKQQENGPTKKTNLYEFTTFLNRSIFP